LGAIEINNRKGDIRVFLPAKAAFQVSASTSHGDISSDFGLNVQNRSGASDASGTIGHGGPAVAINNSYGDIQIRKTGQPGT
jgi:hypothetical protein